MNWSLLYRKLGYVLTTFAITASAQLESLNFDFEHIEKKHWYAIIMKSLLPGIVTLKAYLDNSLHETKEDKNEDPK